MPFDWADYLSLAWRLANEPDEASRRSAVSRAHYACYGTAARYALEHGFPHAVVTHDRIWEWYHRLDDPSGRLINEIGKQVRDSRIVADYRADDDRIAAQARVVCRWADQLSELLSVLPDPTELPNEPSSQ